MLKRTLAVLISVVLLASCFCVTAFAASQANIVITADKSEAKPGEEVTFTVSLVNANNIASGVTNFEYWANLNGFENVGASASSTTVFEGNYMDVSGSSVHGSSYGYAVKATEPGCKDSSVVLGTITVKIPDDAAAGTLTASVSGYVTEKEIGQKEDGSVSVSKASVDVNGGSADVTILCDHTADGWSTDDSDHWHECSKCGAVYDKAAHTMSVTSDTATCGKDGVKTSKCSVCGYTKTQTSPATGNHSYQLVSDTATCGKDGVKTYKCSVCGHTKTETSPATGNHNYQLVSDTATCGKAGEKTYKCSVCGHTKTETSAATGNHTFRTSWATDEVNHWHECEVCGEKSEFGAHVFHWVQDEPATVDKTGLKHEECEICGYLRNLGTVIDKLPEDIDQVPNTGDITPYILFGTVSVFGMMAAAVYVFKRKAVK